MLTLGIPPHPVTALMVTKEPLRIEGVHVQMPL